MSNLLFTALIIALLYYFFYYLPQKKKEEFTPSPKFNPDPFTPSESDKDEIKFPTNEVSCPGPKFNPDPQIELKNQVSALEKEKKELLKDIQKKDREIIDFKNHHLSNSKLQEGRKRDAEKFQTEITGLKNALNRKNLEIKELSEAENQIDQMIKGIKDLEKDLDHA